MALADSSVNDYFSRLSADGDDGTEFIDRWDTGELLLLASSVLRSDRNWVSVTRSIKPFGEHTRPSDWYTPKNCALQYTKLLSEIDEDSKKKTLPRTERETSEVMLVKNLTDRRLNELSWLNQATKNTADILRAQLEMVENGELDEHLDDIIKQIDEQEKLEVEHYHSYLAQREKLNNLKKLNKSRVIKKKTSVRVIDPRKTKIFAELVEETPLQQISLDIVKNEADSPDKYSIPKPMTLKSKIDSPHLSALLDSKVTPTSPNSPSLASFLKTIVTSPIKEEEPLRKLHPDPSSSPLLNSLLKNSPSVPILSPGKEVSPKSISLSQTFNILTSPQGALSSNLPRFLHQPVSPDEKKSVSPSSTACQSAPYLSKLLEMPLSTPGRLPPLPVLDSPTSSSTDVIPRKLKTEPSTPTKISDLKIKIDQLTPEKKTTLTLPIQNVHPEIDSSIVIKKEVSEEENDPVEEFAAISSSIKQEALEKTEVPCRNIELEEVFMVSEMEVSVEEITSAVIPKGDLLAESSKEHSTKVQSASKELDEVFFDADSSTPVFLSPPHMEEDKNYASELEEISSTTTPTTTVSNTLSKDAENSKSISPFSKTPHNSDKTEMSEDEMPLSARRGRKAKKARGRPPKMPRLEDGDVRDQYEFSDTTDDNMPVEVATNTICYMPRQKDEDTKDSEDGSVSSSVEKRSSPQKNKQSKVAGRKGALASDEDRTSDWLASTSDETSSHTLSEDKLKKWEESCIKKTDQDKTYLESNKVFSRSLKSTESPKKKTQANKKSPITKATATSKERKLSGIDSEEMSACSRDSDDTSRTWQKDGSDGKNTPLDAELETSSSLAAESDIEKTAGENEIQFSPQAAASHMGGKQDWFQPGSPKSFENASQSSEESEYESDNWDNQSVSTNKSATVTSPHPRLNKKDNESSQYKAWKKAISIVLREASCHKYANVFLQKVTNDVAPGYLGIVNRPMDLSLIKKNIDSGIIRTTEEFLRDMLLMFQNAIMYNSSDHDVYHMAVVMQKDVLELLEAFLTTQKADIQESNEVTSSLRGSRKSAKVKQTPASAVKAKEEIVGD